MQTRNIQKCNGKIIALLSEPNHQLILVAGFGQPWPSSSSPSKVCESLHTRSSKSLIRRSIEDWLQLVNSIKKHIRFKYKQH